MAKLMLMEKIFSSFKNYKKFLEEGENKKSEKTKIKSLAEMVMDNYNNKQLEEGKTLEELPALIVFVTKVENHYEINCVGVEKGSNLYQYYKIIGENIGEVYTTLSMLNKVSESMIDRLSLEKIGTKIFSSVIQIFDISDTKYAMYPSERSFKEAFVK